MRFGLRTARVFVASACSPSVEPMPQASAPSPPSVQVWLSGQTSVTPGSAMPCSGDTTWTMPWRSSPRSKRWMPAARADARVLVMNSRPPGMRVSSVRPGRGVHDVIHRAEHLLGMPDLPAGGFQALEGDAAGPLVEEDAVDEEQAGVVAEVGDGVLVPELVDDRAAHGALLVVRSGAVSASRGNSAGFSGVQG